MAAEMPVAPEVVAVGRYRDLACLTRGERQELYAGILKEKQCMMTPGHVKVRPFFSFLWGFLLFLFSFLRNAFFPFFFFSSFLFFFYQEELERRGMTFAFVGQDMAAMRLMPFISIEARGQYQWKNSYKGDWTQHFAKTKKHPGWGGGRKRVRIDPPQFVVQDDSVGDSRGDDSEGSWSASRSSKSAKYPTVAHSLFGSIQVSDEESLKEKDRALRNLDMLLAIAEERDHDPEFVEVCGFRVRK